MRKTKKNEGAPIKEKVKWYAYQQRLQPEEAIQPHLHLSDSLERWRSLGKRVIAVPLGVGHKQILGSTETSGTQGQGQR